MYEKCTVKGQLNPAQNSTPSLPVTESFPHGTYIGSNRMSSPSTRHLLDQKSSEDDDILTNQPILSTTTKCELDDDDPYPRDERPRTPILTGPIIELRGREVIFAIAVFFLVAIVVGLIVVLASNKVKEFDDAFSNPLSNLSGIDATRL